MPHEAQLHLEQRGEDRTGDDPRCGALEDVLQAMCRTCEPQREHLCVRALELPQRDVVSLDVRNALDDQRRRRVRFADGNAEDDVRRCGLATDGRRDGRCTVVATCEGAGDDDTLRRRGLKADF